MNWILGSAERAWPRKAAAGGAFGPEVAAGSARIQDPQLVERLDEMYEVHLANIRRCADFIKEPP
jgi:hypothetical protein